MKQSLKTILDHLPGRLRAPLERAAVFYEAEANEIILRSKRPVVIECADKRYYLTGNGVLTACSTESDILTTTTEELLHIFKSICNYSVYSRQQEINNGYITIDNGVRVGICGTAIADDGAIVNIKDITTLCFRISSEVKGCAEKLLSKVDPLDGILVIGPPCSGKTTMIRDMARLLSEKYKVSVLDERNELSAVNGGCFAYDIGLSDVVVNMKKSEGVGFALRSLSPDILICDELGGREDIKAMNETIRCGIAFIATLHARSLSELKQRKSTSDILRSGAFRYVVALCDRRHAGTVKKIYELRDVCA